jgi:hypothetical protein
MKIKTLRYIKTEALLIYIRTICQDYILKLERKEYKLDIGNEESAQEIIKSIYFLKKNLDKCVFTGYELNSFVNTYLKNNQKTTLPIYYQALIFYYNNIILELENNLSSGDLWIAEQIILSLISEWIFEEENPTKEYPFLMEIDYLKLLGYFEFARNNTKKNSLKKEVRLMFQISSHVINRLKKSKFKINTTRKSKTRVSRK